MNQLTQENNSKTTMIAIIDSMLQALNHHKEDEIQQKMNALTKVAETASTNTRLTKKDHTTIKTIQIQLSNLIQ